MSIAKKPETTPPLRNILLSGSAWMVAVRWVVRGLGAVNVVVLARLLTPEDFGVVAMATAVVGLSRVFFELGVDYALIRNADATDSDFHAAWSIRLLQSIAVAAVLVLVAPYAVLYYDDHRVAPLLWVLAVSVIIQGLTNIGIVSFRKDLEFDKEFKYLVVAKVLSIGITISLALVLRSYWALVLGILAAYVVECVLSYFFHPFRPKLRFTGARAIWSFSKWVAVLQTANYLSANFDRLLLGGLLAPGRLGHYTVGVELSQMAATEITAPISRAIVPGLAKLQTDPKRLRTAFLKSLGATAIVTVPVSIGFALVAKEFVPIVLGAQWTPAIAIVQVASVHLMFTTLGTVASNISLVTGHISTLATLSVVRTAIFLSLFYIAFDWAGVLGILYIKIALAAALSIAILGMISRTHHVPPRAIVSQIWRPLTSSATMAFCILAFTTNIDGTPMSILGIKIVFGAAIYIVTNVTLWRMFGHQDDIENEILKLLKKLVY